jgi:hypothetical protein
MSLSTGSSRRSAGMDATKLGPGVVQMPQDEREIVEPDAQRRFNRCRRLTRERAAGQVRRVDTD